MYDSKKRPHKIVIYSDIHKMAAWMQIRINNYWRII